MGAHKATVIILAVLVALVIMGYPAAARGTMAHDGWRPGEPGQLTEAWSGGEPAPVLLAKKPDKLNPHETLPANLPAPPVPSPTPSYGSLAVSSSPSGALLYVDALYRGTTPVNLTGMPSGAHAIRLQLEGYYTYEGSIQITGGRTTVVSGVLQPDSRNPLAPSAPGDVPDTPSAQEWGWENPGVMLAVLGIITSIIGAVVTMVSIISTWKKD